jgi:hypothetical protein
MKISKLPQNVKELALLRQQEEKDLEYNKTTDDLNYAFNWYLTEEQELYWEQWDNNKLEIIIPKNYDDVIAIIETKIAKMSSRGFESYYLPIGILKDLIREIKEIK